MIPAAKIFAIQLAKFSEGEALWAPEPPEGDVPIELGDVGWITGDGQFTRMFNATVPDGHRLNDCGIPPDYKPLVVDTKMRRVLKPHRAAIPFLSEGMHQANREGHLGA